jgi:thiol-disulfide isomerase/thioredoxin
MRGVADQPSGMRRLWKGEVASSTGGRPRLWWALALLLGLLIAARAGGLGTAAEVVRLGAVAPDLTFTTPDGRSHRLSEFRGRPVLLWLVATWCPSCQAGTAAVARHLPELAKAGMTVIQLRLYDNLGYPGPSMAEFIRAAAGPVRPSPAWVWGDASQAASYLYDPRGYPDIYFLIDRHGVLRAVNGAPNVTMDEILAFARRAP